MISAIRGVVAKCFVWLFCAIAVLATPLTSRDGQRSNLHRPAQLVSAPPPILLGGSVNTPPTIAPITNQTINIGQRLAVSARASDAETAVQNLQFSLKEKPERATLRIVRGTNAIIGWTPTRADAKTTNRFTVAVTDNGVPSLTTTQTFQVIVTDFAQSALGTTVIPVGQDGCLPLSVDATESFTNIELTIAIPPGHFTNLSVQPTLPEVCGGNLRSVSDSLAVVRLFTCPGKALTLTQAVDIADLCFTALPDQPSAFTRLSVTNIALTTTNGRVVVHPSTSAGTVVIVGTKPLLEASLTQERIRQMFLYAQPGSFYQVEWTTNLSLPIVWQLSCRVPMTGPALALCCVDAGNSTAFFRATQLGVGPTNEPPRVYAGPDQVVHTNVALVGGFVTDDGLPEGCKPLIYSWSLASGPSPATFESRTSLVTKVTFNRPGAYVFRLKASDGQATNFDDVRVAYNKPPLVQAGIARTATVGEKFVLKGTIIDDDLPFNTITSTWSIVTGPATVSVVQVGEGTAEAVFPVVGSYTARLTATDGDYTASDQTTVNVLDCSFPSTLQGWSVHASGPGQNSIFKGTFAPGSVVPTTDGSCSAIMTEGDSFLVTLTRSLALPASSASLAFDYELSFDQTTTNAVKDAFEAALLDDSGVPLTYTVGAGRDAFFNSSDGESPLVARGAAITNGAVKLNLDAASRGRIGRLIFRLVNNDRDSKTTVRIRNLRLKESVAAEDSSRSPSLPSSPPRFDGGDVASLSDVAASVIPEYHSSSFDDGHRVLSVDLALRNNGTFNVRGPLMMVIENLSDPAIQLVDPDGATPAGLPYVLFTLNSTNRLLRPSDLTSRRLLKFSNPNEGQFTYDLKILGQLNSSPEFTGNPLVEALVTQAYSYEARARDPDLDELRFELLTGPSSMNVDRTTGVVSWVPSLSDLGTHQVRLSVEDGNGGRAEQTFLVNVSTLPANRPPTFTSAPIVAIGVGDDYVYQAVATDPDNDVLRFTIVDGPTGMTIDQTNGLVRWNGIAPDAPAGFPVVPGFTVEQYAVVTDPTLLSFSPDGVMYVGRDASGSGGGFFEAVRIHKVGPRGLPVEDYGTTPILDPDAVAVDWQGTVSGVAGSILVGSSTPTGGLISAIHPDQAVLPVFGPTPRIQNPVRMLFDNTGRFVYSENDEHGNGRIMMSRGEFPSPLFASGPLSGFFAIDQQDQILTVVITNGHRRLELHSSNGSLVNDDILGEIGSALVEPDVGFGRGGKWEQSLYVLDEGKLYRSRGKGDLQQVGSSFPTNSTMIFGPDQALYIADFLGDRVFRVYAPESSINVSLQVSDAHGGVASQTYRIALLTNSTNHSPVIVSQPVTSVVPGETYRYTVDAIDADNDPIKYSLTYGPDGMAINPTNGLIEWAPAESFFRKNVLEFADQEFLSSDWATDLFTSKFGGTALVDQVLTGGNPGAYRRISLNGYGSSEVESPSYAYLFNWRLRATYNPREDGPIGAIDYFEDQIAYDPFGGDGGLALRQNGKIYIFGSFPHSTQLWSSRSRTNLKQSDFYKITFFPGSIQPVFEESPDFSESGSSIELGFFRYEANCGACPGFSNSSGIDNWRVVITPQSITTVEVTVSDSRGGSANQKFQVGASLPGEIQGFAFEDLNHDARWDRGPDMLVAGDGLRRYHGQNGALIQKTSGFVALGMALSADGNIYLAVPDSRIMRFNGVSGEFLDVFLDNARLRTAWGIAFGPDGNLYVGDAGRRNVLKFDGRTGNYITNFDSGRDLNLPFEITFGPDGNLYVANTDPDVISEFDGKNGKFIRDLSGGIDLPSGLTFGPDGYLYVASWFSRNVVRFDVRSGKFIDEFVPRGSGGLGRAHSLTFGPDGDLYVLGFENNGTNNTILHYSGRTAAFLGQFAFGESGLEPRVILFTPGNSNALAEPGLSGRVVYVDANRNGRRDSEERFCMTDANGQYALTNLAAGTYVVREESQVGWLQTAPANQLFILTVTNSQTIYNIDFGNYKAAEAIGNMPPRFFTAPVTNVTAQETYLYDAEASDPNGDLLLFDLAVRPVGMTIDPATGIIGWTPRLDEVGAHNVLLRVRDQHGGFDLQSFKITVNPPNTHPVIVSTPPTNAVVNLAYQYEVRAQDAENDELRFALAKAPEGMVIAQSTADANAAVVRWVPSVAQTGVQRVALTVVDRSGGTVRQEFEIFVRGVASNSPPVIISQPVTSIVPGQIYTYNVDAIDADKDPLNFVLIRKPDGMSIDPANGLIEWEATPAFFTNHNVIFFDDTFAGSHWDMTTWVADGGGSVAFSQMFSDGAAPPSATLRVNVLGAPSSKQQPVVAELGFQKGSTYSISRTGAIFGINYSVTELSPSHFGSFSGLALRQGTNVYAAYYSLPQSPTWITNHLSGLTARDFAAVDLRGPGDFFDADRHPDFSGAGADIEFGFLKLTYNCIGCPGPFSFDYGIDNWSVEVAPTQSANVELAVNDTSGAAASQSFLISAGQPTAIQGYAFDDQDRNGVWNRGPDLLVDSLGLYRFHGTTGSLIERSDAPFSAVGPDRILYGWSSRVLFGHDLTTGNIFRFATNTTAAVSWTTFGPNGNVFVSDGQQNSVLQFDGRTGGFLGTFGLGESIHGAGAIAFYNDGKFYATDPLVTPGGVLRYDATTGKYLDSLKTGELVTPIGLTFGSDGNLYISGFVSHNVCRFNPFTGAYLGEFVPSRSGGLINPTGIAFGPDGNLYVSGLNYGIWRYSGLTGAFIDRFITRDILFQPRAIQFTQLTLPSTSGVPEPGLPGELIFLDQNRNGRRDPGERYTVTDVNGQYAFTNLASGTYFVREEPRLGWLQTDPSNQVYILSVTNGQVVYNIDFGNFHADTTATNLAPHFVSNPRTNAVVGEAYRYDALAVDPEGQPINYGLVSTPAGMAVDPQTGTVVWIPQGNQIGGFDVVLEATDPIGSSVKQSFSVKVDPGLTNHPPVIISEPVTSIVPGRTYGYDVEALDPDGDGLIYSLSTAPVGMSINASNGLIVWSPDASYMGTNTMVFADGDFVTDGWRVETYADRVGGDAISFRAPDGGVFGAFERIQLRVNGSVVSSDRPAIYRFFFNTNANYSPALSGAILGIDYAEDAIQLSSSDYSIGQSGGFALKQAGKIFFTPYLVSGFQPSWTNITLSELSELTLNPFTLPEISDDFDPFARPDFSTNGAPIEFGFFRAWFSCPGCQGGASEAGIDNWTVRVRRAPSTPVTIVATDGKGASAIQSFQVATVRPSEIRGFAFGDTNLDRSWERAPDLLVASGSLWRFLTGSGAVADRSLNYGIVAVTVGPDGLAYCITTSGQIVRFEPISGRFIGVFSSGSYPRALSDLKFGPDGNLYVGEQTTDSILKFDGGNGKFLGVLASGGPLDLPYDLVFGPDELLYVASALRFQVIRYDVRSGAYLGMFAAQNGADVDGLAFGPDGNLYVSAWHQHLVAKFDGRSGASLGNFVQPGSGGLNLADTLIFGPPGKLYVAGLISHNILSYSASSGEFEKAFFQGDKGFAPSGLALTSNSSPGVSEPTLPGWTVYLDQNRNGRRDPGEDFAITDTNGQYALTNLPAGTYYVREEPQSGWLQTAPSNQIYILSVTNGQVVYNIDFGNNQTAGSIPNRAPFFVSTPPTNTLSLQPYRYDALAIDPLGSALSYSLQVRPPGMAVGLLNGTVVWTPQFSQIGSFQVEIHAANAAGLIATQQFVLKVDATNLPPSITSAPPQRGRAAVGYSYKVQALDPNGDSLNYSLWSKPEGMALSSSGLVSWTPSFFQVGSNAVVIRVDDGRGGVATQSFSIDVQSQAATQPLTITSVPRFAATVGQEYSYDAKAFSPNGGQLAWGLDQAPRGMSIGASVGTVRWTPLSDQLGTNRVSIRVFDGLGGVGQQSFDVVVRAANLPPLISSIPPTSAVIGRSYTYQLLVSDPENDPLRVSLVSGPTNMTLNLTNALLQWIPNSSQLGTQLVEIQVEDPSGGAGGQLFSVVVTTNQNRYPTITSVPIFQAVVGQLYSYQIQATDPDGDVLSYELRSGPPGLNIDTNSGLVSWRPIATQAGRSLVTVAAVDRLGAASRQTFSIDVTSLNRPPQIISDHPGEITIVGLPYRYDVQAVDPDGDPLTYRLVTSPPGMIIDSLGRVSWTSTPADVGTNVVELQVVDTHGAAQNQNFPLLVLPDTTVPLVGLSVTPNPATLNSRVFFNVRASDQSGQPTLALAVDGGPIALDSSGGASFTVARVGLFKVVASATDAAGNISSRTNLLQVVDPSNTNAPSVALSSPADDALLTSSTDVIGSVEDDDLVAYTLSIAPITGGDFREIARGFTSVTNGVLGKLDPAAFQNDSYILRLEATDAVGNVSTTEETFHVAGDLKLGNFRLSFTDLSVPVAGIPITVTRTYDTLQSGSSGDFGFGWRLEFRETALRASLPNFANQLDASTFHYIPFRTGTRVYTTLPGGRRQGFTFRPQPYYGFYGTYLFIPKFVPDDGVTSELRVPDENLQYFLFVDTLTGEFYDYASLRPYNPADNTLVSEYTLTTKEGVKFSINSQEGSLKSAVDPNGNRLIFTSSGIRSSSGPEVIFDRDPQGRIIAVTDPMGNKVRYQYDANGDLVSVTDRATNTTRFVYHPSMPHYLQEVIDPLGRSGVRANYDEQGRLAALADAGSNTVQLIHDPDNFVEQIVDTLGNPTTYEYDTRGNVVTEVDSLGAVVRREYDQNNNMTREVDALGSETLYTYDGRGNVLTRTDSNGKTTRFTYNSLSQVVSTTDPLGNTTLNQYDSRGNLLASTDPLGNTSRYSYDGAGNATSITDPAGNTTSMEYDGGGHLTRQVDALGNATSYAYDGNGNQIEQRTTVSTSSGPRVLITRTSYDAAGRPTAVTNAEGSVVRTEYDPVGKTIATIDALNHRTQFVYDERGKLTTTVFPDGTSNSVAYDAAGHRTSSTDRAGRTTYYEYDAVGRSIATIYPDDTPSDLSDNPRTRTEYDSAGRVVATIDERSNRAEFTYDSLGRQIRVRDALGNETWTSYDDAGRQTAVTNALGRVVQFNYDALGRRVETVFPDSSRKRTIYDALGRVVAEVDQAGVTNRFQYDAVGRLTNVVDALGNSTSYSYDEGGNLIRQKDANAHITRYEYDGLGRRIATVLPLGQRSVTSYNPVGNVAVTTNFNGQVITFDYDINNRLAKKLIPLTKAGGYQTNLYSYTPTGQRGSISDARGVTRFTYDARDRLASRVDPDGRSIRYTYDLGGNRTATITDAQTNRFTFDALGRLETVIDPDSGITRYTYDAANNVVLMALPNGTLRTNVYDELGRLTYLEHRNNTGVFASYRYTLGPTGNRVAVQEQDGRQVRYDYDPLYRLVRESIARDPVGPNLTNSYVYDATGNRQFQTNSVEGVTSYAYDENDELLSESRGGLTTKYTYDANGNTLSRSNAVEQATYGWSPESRLIAATVNGTNGLHQLAYQYDDDGIRVGAISDTDETRYMIDANRPYAQVIEEWTSHNSQTFTLTASYTHGPHHLISQSRSGVRSWYHADGLGSTRMLTGSRGVATDGYTFDAYGRSITENGKTANLYLYAGEQRDKMLGLDYLRSRYLRCEQGGFFGHDFLVGNRFSPPTLHRYVYGRLDPVNNLDPNGTEFLSAALLSALVVAADTTSDIYSTSFSAASYVRRASRAQESALAFAILTRFGQVDLLDRRVSTGDKDRATARENIADTANSLRASRNFGGTAPGGEVFLDRQMLTGMLHLSYYYSFRVSTITGGEHSDLSRHYEGVAFDVDQVGGRPVNSENSEAQDFMRDARFLGATEVLGPGDMGHDRHIHLAWPRPVTRDGN